VQNWVVEEDASTFQVNFLKKKSIHTKRYKLGRVHRTLLVGKSAISMTIPTYELTIALMAVLLQCTVASY
jgi:hypothetical protein